MTSFICPACWPSPSSAWRKMRKASAVTFPGFNDHHHISEGRELIWLLGLQKVVLQKMAGCRRKLCLWTGHGCGIGWMEQSEASSNSHVFSTLCPNGLLVGVHFWFWWLRQIHPSKVLPPKTKNPVSLTRRSKPILLWSEYPSPHDFPLWDSYLLLE